mgnify:CR=1 FL=1
MAGLKAGGRCRMAHGPFNPNTASQSRVPRLPALRAALEGGHPADERHDRPVLEEGEFHLLDLVGLEARLGEQGDVVGTVTDLISGGNDLLELKRPDGRTLLVPFVEAIVPEVKLKEGWLLLTPPPGLLEL